MRPKTRCCVDADTCIRKVVKERVSRKPWLSIFGSGPNGSELNGAEPNGECPKARLPMLAAMYLGDDRFRPFYDRFGEGTAALMHDGLLAYAASD
ncbi:hypothetical protein Sama_2691 [Shewanella amazonensis SB2B]|uniref:TipAS antibiotic-recognition domain-containing protein n=1 Tax=Shewanella amazonensis (strain ATCC BAA-1098 / SB2B) TaxID=326297 RepID=A1S937_SHEAM|nr:TipAS antibiotic-recognition domain-containing protein [Shewanella amazonensis]ABM00894.1 hypothetical protein Sama_2691 [Shewanella amazonensis SB2B]